MPQQNLVVMKNRQGLSRAFHKSDTLQQNLVVETNRQGCSRRLHGGDALHQSTHSCVLRCRSGNLGTLKGSELELVGTLKRKKIKIACLQ